MTLEVGQQAPDFRVVDDSGNERTLNELKGKTVVLYFYPKDNTAGCSQEAQEFRDLQAAFEAKNAVVLGASKDSVASHQRFKAKYSLPFALLSDTEGTLLDAYGAWGEKKNYGRTYMGIIRSTVVIDGEGRVQAVYPNVKVKGHAQKVLESLG